MSTEYIKVSDTIFKEVVIEPTERPLTIMNLKMQLRIHTDELARAEAKIAEVNALLAKAEELGVVEKETADPVEPVDPVPIVTP